MTLVFNGSSGVSRVFDLGVFELSPQGRQCELIATRALCRFILLIENSINIMIFGGTVVSLFTPLDKPLNGRTSVVIEVLPTNREKYFFHGHRDEPRAVKRPRISKAVQLFDPHLVEIAAGLHPTILHLSRDSTSRPEAPLCISIGSLF